MLDLALEALEVLPDGRVLALPDSGAGMTVYEIDPNIGEVSVIVLNLPALGGALNGLAATGNTSMLATTDMGELLNINLTTGNATMAGQQGIGWMDLAVHPTNGRAYTVSRRRFEASGTSHLYEINTSTGQIIAEIGDLRRKFVSDIDFAPDGTLYGNNGGQLIVIDTTNGSNTRLGRFGPDPLEPFSHNTQLENNLLQTAKGSIRFTTGITLPTETLTSVSREYVKINFNDAMVDSKALPYLDVPARITLTGLAGSGRALLVDENDDGTFNTCLPPRCTMVSFSGGTLVFDVTGFTTYSSVVKSDDGLKKDSDWYAGSISPWILLLFFAGVLGRRLRARSR
jgi:hypothetical protein